ncbi:hypothetical protein IscW_ISCW024647, partial [Ixodes scapularis]
MPCCALRPRAAPWTCRTLGRGPPGLRWATCRPWLPKEPRRPTPGSGHCGRGPPCACLGPSCCSAICRLPWKGSRAARLTRWGPPASPPCTGTTSGAWATPSACSRTPCSCPCSTRSSLRRDSSAPVS